MLFTVTKYFVAPQKRPIQIAIVVNPIFHHFVQPAGRFVKRADTDAVQAGAGMITLPESDTFFTVYGQRYNPLRLAGLHMSVVGSP